MQDPFRHMRSVTEDLYRSLAIYGDFATQVSKSTSSFTAIQESLAAQRAIDRALIDSATSALSAVRLADITSNLGDVVSANKALADVVSQATLANSTVSKLFAEHSNLRASLAAMAAVPSAQDLFSSLETTRLLHASFSSQCRLRDLETHAFGCRIDASHFLANDLAATFSKLTRTYRDVIEALPVIPQAIVPFVATHAPVEYSLEVDVLEGISIERNEEAGIAPLPSVDNEIALFDDRLLALLNGARESLKSDNPDRARHVTTSVRELLTQVLHGLAPDAEIRKWSSDAAHYHNNRPTRRARLLYICRTFSCDPLTKFVEEDVRSALALVDSLNAGTHVVQSKLTPFQLRAIVCRMESLALFLLKVSRGGD